MKMKKTKKILAYALCILLSVIVACSTLTTGAAGAETSYSNPTGSDLSYVAPTPPSQKEPDEIIKDVVGDLGLEDDLSNAGEDLKDFSKDAEGFLQKLIEKIKSIVETISQYLKQIFRTSTFD